MARIDEINDRSYAKEPLPKRSPDLVVRHRIGVACGTSLDLKAIVYDFTLGRAGEHARAFLGNSRGKLVCDYCAGYQVGFGKGIIGIVCVAIPGASSSTSMPPTRATWRRLRHWTILVSIMRSNGKPNSWNRTNGNDCEWSWLAPAPMRCNNGCLRNDRRCPMALVPPRP